MLNKIATRKQVWSVCFAIAAIAASSMTMQAAPVIVNSGFQGGPFGTFAVTYDAGDTGLNLQQVRFDLQSPLFVDPTFATPGALFPLPFGSVTGAGATGFAGATGIVDGATSFTLLFNHFAPGETFMFQLDLDTPCGGLLCQGAASWVTGSEFAGTTITGTFGGPSFHTAVLSGSFSATGSSTAQAVLNGEVEPVPEPQTVGLMMAGLAALAVGMHKRGARLRG